MHLDETVGIKPILKLESKLAKMEEEVDRLLAYMRLKTIIERDIFEPSYGVNVGSLPTDSPKWKHNQLWFPACRK